MSLKNKILIQSLNWRIKYLESVDDSINKDAKFVYNVKDMTNDHWLQIYNERLEKSDNIRSKIHACQSLIADVKKDEEVSLNYPSVMEGLLFCTAIAGCAWVLLKFAEFQGAL